MKSTIEDTEKKLPRLEKLEMGKLDLRKSLAKLKLHSKEAEPEENMEDAKDLEVYDGDSCTM